MSKKRGKVGKIGRVALAGAALAALAPAAASAAIVVDLQVIGVSGASDTYTSKTANIHQGDTITVGIYLSGLSGVGGGVNGLANYSLSVKSFGETYNSGTAWPTPAPGSTVLNATSATVPTLTNFTNAQVGSTVLKDITGSPTNYDLNDTDIDVFKTGNSQSSTPYTTGIGMTDSFLLGTVQFTANTALNDPTKGLNWLAKLNTFYSNTTGGGGGLYVLGTTGTASVSSNLATGAANIGGDITVNVTASGNNSVLSLSGTSVVAGINQISPAAVNVGRVLVGSSVGTSLALSKSGTDSTSYSVVTTGDATSTSASASTLYSGSPSINAALNTATAGAKSGYVTIKNLASDSAGPGQGSADINEQINVNGTVVNARVVAGPPTPGVSFGRVMYHSAVVGTAAISSSGLNAVTENADLAAYASGADGNGVSLSAGAHAFHGATDGSDSSTNATFGGHFNSYGTNNIVSGTFDLSGSMSYELSTSPAAVTVGYTANVLDNRIVSATPIHLGRFVGTKGGDSTLSTSSGTDAQATRLTVNGTLFNDNSVTSTYHLAPQGGSGSIGGTVTLTPTGEGLNGEVDAPVSIAWDGTALQNRVVTAAPIHLGRFVGTLGGTSALSTTGDSAHFTSITVDGQAFNSATSTGTYTLAAQGGSGAIGGSVALSVVGEGVAGETPVGVSVAWDGSALQNRVVTAAPIHLGRFVGTLGGTSALSTTGDSAHFTSITVDGQAFNSATSTGTYTLAAQGGSGAIGGSVALSVVGEGVVGETPVGVSVAWDGTALQNRVVTAAPIHLGRFVGTLGGTSALSTTGDSAHFTSITVDGQAFNSATSTGTYTLAAQGGSGAIGGSVALSVVGEGVAGETPVGVSVAWDGTALQNRVVTATPINLGRFVGTKGGVSSLSTTGDSSQFTSITVAGQAFNSAGSTGTYTLAPQGGSGPISGSVALTVVGEGVAGENPVPVSVAWQGTALQNRVVTASAIDLGRFLGTKGGVSNLTTSGDSNHFTSITVDGQAFNSAASAGTFTLAPVGGSGPISGDVPLTVVGEGVDGEAPVGVSVHYSGTALASRVLTPPTIALPANLLKNAYVGGTSHVMSPGDHAHYANLTLNGAAPVSGMSLSGTPVTFDGSTTFAADLTLGGRYNHYQASSFFDVFTELTTDEFGHGGSVGVGVAGNGVGVATVGGAVLHGGTSLGMDAAGLASKTLTGEGGAVGTEAIINAGTAGGDVTMSWRLATAADKAHGILSDVVDVEGMQGVYVLQLTYADPTGYSATHPIKLAYNAGGWVGAEWYVGNQNTRPEQGAWVPGDTTLGDYGKVINGDGTYTVWTVVNMNGEFAAIPQPAAIWGGLVGLAGLGFMAARRRFRR